MTKIVGGFHVAVILVGLSVAPALAGPSLPPASFAPPEEGAKQIWRDVEANETGKSEILEPDGYRVMWRWNGTIRKGYLFCTYCAGGAPAPEDEYAKLWPLEVGKRVEFTRHSNTGTGRWNTSIEVTGTETIDVGEIGPVDTYVVRYESRRSQGSWHGETVSYYAPSIGWTVRFRHEDNEGESWHWEMVSNETP